MNRERAFKMLPGLYVSEKAMGLTDDKSQLIFKAVTDAAELEIKKTVGSLFSMKVQHVTTLNARGKTKRTVRGPGRRNDWKKAYVALQPGQDLDFATSTE